ncbi:hypothetical protein [Asticcacaulis sp.]|uniref:hypothetical protein n=1 Tax=Asticcacaulis sp. TaxID=1872648 RepID=UPI003F7B3CB5
MSTTLDNSLVHQQSDVLEYINEIAQELAQMAERAGCVALGHDLRRALLTAHETGTDSPNEGNASNGREDERGQERL